MSQTVLETHDIELAHDAQRDDLMARFLKHVSISPEAIALVTTEETWTYHMLYQEVLKWKITLSQHVETRAIVFLARTPRLIAILLALQWLRVTYIPLDLNTPIQRLLSIIEDSQAQTLLHDTRLSTQDFPCVVLNIEQIAHHHYIHPPEAALVEPGQSDLAYVIYTSGSTGKPKGVAITTHALNHFLVCMSRVFLREKNAMLLAVTTIAFDIAQLELWLPLWQKRALFLTTQSEHRDPIVLKNILATYPITLLQSTPSFWSMLYAAGWRGKPGLVALCGGEALSETLAAQLLNSVASLWNMYGPTEATIWCAMKELHPHMPITIGRPIEGMSFLVLDDAMHQLPPHVKGELYIAGVGLAQGYVNRDDLNRERFMMFEGKRFYRVGDVAMQTSDGEFVILGRTDNQIKLHGYRIELEEIEAAIKQDLSISNAAVVVVQEQLVAYVSCTLNTTYSEAALKEILKQVLPPYMVPTRWIVLETLPLSLSGKIDRQALPKPTMLVSMPVSGVTPLESDLCMIWQKALRCPVTPLDNFFALGGHSLIAARIVAEIGEQLSKSLTLDALYRAPTVRTLAGLIEQASSYAILPVMQRKPGTWLSLTDYQAMFWLSQRFEPGLKVFNVVARRRFEEKLDRELLNKALAFVFHKHPVLSYRLNSFYPAQRSVWAAPIQWRETSLSVDSFETQLAASYDELFYQHRWVADESMVCAKLFYLPEQHTELQICMSHLIADERALSIFFEDLCIAYDYYRQYGRAPIQKSIVSFEHYLLRAEERFQVKQEEKTAFWKTYLADTGYFPMPSKYVVPKMTGVTRDYVTEVDFPESLLRGLRKFCAHHQLTLNDVLIAAVGLSLQQCTAVDCHPILINTVKSTRTEACFDETIGCFLEMMVIKLKLDGTQTLLETAHAAQRSWIETLHYQDVPSLVKYASIGQSPLGLGWIKRAMIYGGMACYRKWVQRRMKDTRLLQASADVAGQDRKGHFFVSLNLLNSFIEPMTYMNKLKEIPIPSHSFPVMPLTSVLDVWFYSEHGQFRPKLLIAANLETMFRERFVETLLRLLQEAQQVGGND